jgi:hypothetical protein
VDACTKAEGKGGVVEVCWKVEVEGTADIIEGSILPKVMTQHKWWKNPRKKEGG